MERCYDADTFYDITAIKKLAKKKLISALLLLSLHLSLFVLSILVITLCKSYPVVFILGLVLAPYSFLSFLKVIKTIPFSDYKNSIGKIAKTNKDIRTVKTTAVGGINIGGIRKYDSYTKKEVRLDVFIKEGDKILLYHLRDANEHHADYYEKGGNAIHIWGTHFPVKTTPDAEKWLCPICGEFNANEKKNCNKCNKKVLK